MLIPATEDRSCPSLLPQTVLVHRPAYLIIPRLPNLAVSPAMDSHFSVHTDGLMNRPVLPVSPRSLQRRLIHRTSPITPPARVDSITTGPCMTAQPFHLLLCLTLPVAVAQLAPALAAWNTTGPMLTLPLHARILRLVRRVWSVISILLPPLRPTRLGLYTTRTACKTSMNGFVRYLRCPIFHPWPCNPPMRLPASASPISVSTPQ